MRQEAEKSLSPDIDVLELLPRSTLSAMLESDLRKPEQIAQVLWSYGNSGGEYNKLAEARVSQFVELSLQRLKATLDELEYRFEDSSFNSNKILKDYLKDGLLSSQSQPSVNTTWPWTILDVDPSDYHSEKSEGKYKHNAFYILGYRTGKTKGMHIAERREFMDWFYMETLPPVIAACFGQEFGEPESDQRLRSMANSLAQKCVGFKMKDAQVYRYAIADFEEDLKYLKSRFYKEGSFPWPPTF